MSGVVDKDTQEMKKALQAIIMDECSDLFQLYDFRLVQLSAQRDDLCAGYSFAAGVMSPRVDGGKTLYVQAVLPRTVIFDHPYYVTATQSLAHSNVVTNVFHQLARKLRHEVERRTKETPVVANNPFFVNPFTYTTSLTSETMISTMQQVRGVNEEKAMSFANPVKKTISKSKFEYIDSLIADAKKRLYGGYSNPVLSFKYF